MGEAKRWQKPTQQFQAPRQPSTRPMTPRLTSPGNSNQLLTLWQLWYFQALHSMAGNTTPRSLPSRNKSREDGVAAALPCQHLWSCWKPGSSGKATLVCWLSKQELEGPSCVSQVGSLLPAHPSCFWKLSTETADASVSTNEMHHIVHVPCLNADETLSCWLSACCKQFS